MFELVIGNKDGSIDNASIPVRWCLTSELLKIINESELINPKIFIIARYNYNPDDYSWDREERHMIDLHQFKTFIPLSKAGKVTISAYIIMSKKGKDGLYKKCFLTKSNSRTHYDFDLETLTDYCHYDDAKFNLISKTTGHNITIPTGVFGKKPAKWLMDLMLRYINPELRDECDLRKHKLIFPFKFILLILPEAIFRYISMLVGYFVYIMLGCSNFNWMYLKHPLLYHGGNVFKGVPSNTCDWDVIDDHTVTNQSLEQNLLFIPFLSLRIPVIWVFALWIMIMIIPEGINQGVYISLLLFSQLIFVYSISLFVALCIGVVELVSYLKVLMSILVGIILITLGYVTYVIITTIDTMQLIDLAKLMLIPISAVVLAMILYKDRSNSKSERLLIKWLVNAITSIDSVFDKWMSRYELWLINGKREKIKNMEEILTCNGKPNEVTNDTSEIPLKYKSLTLIYYTTKNKLCKPLQR